MRAPLAVACAVLLLSTIAPGARAQDTGDFAAYLAHVWTPIGALPPQVTPAMAGLMQTRTRLRGQFGRISFGDADYNALGVGADFGRGRGSMGLTAGYSFASDCDGCDNVVMVGGHLEGVLGSRPLGASPDGARLHAGLRGDVGIGRVDDATLVSAAVGVPVSTPLPSGTMRVVPFLTPALGFGVISDDDSESGVRFLLGGGIGVVGSTGLMLNLGFQKVFIDDGETMFGINVAWNVGQ